MSENEQYFILLLKKRGKKKRSLVSVQSGSCEVELLPGTLLILQATYSKSDKYFFILETFDSDTVEVRCIPGEVEKIGPGAVEILFPVPTSQDRLAVYQDMDWLREGLNLQVQDLVVVKQKGEQREMPGILRFKGKVPNMKGIVFGVELTKDIGSGASDGTFRKTRYFSCPPNSAVFCPIHQIHKLTPGGSRPMRWSENPYATATSHIASQDYPNCRLHQGDRVVWMSDHGPECGTVKWIGVLPGDRTSELTVGVEHDNAVGSGTGKYKEHRLFYARQNHASLVPILGLLKEEEFFSPGGSSPCSYKDEPIQVLKLDHDQEYRSSSQSKLEDCNMPDNVEGDTSLKLKSNTSKSNYSDVLKRGVKDKELIATNYDKESVRSNNLDVNTDKQKIRDPTSPVATTVTDVGTTGMNPLCVCGHGDMTDDLMEEELTCPVCLELFADPLVLPCSHSICKKCIQDILDSRLKLGREGMDCPSCRKVITVTKEKLLALPKNLALENIVFRFQEIQSSNLTKSKSLELGTNFQLNTSSDDCDLPVFCEDPTKDCGLCDVKAPAKAAWFCQQCSVLYCQKCLDTYHPKQGSLAHHKVRKPSKVECDDKAVFCRDHDSEMASIFCDPCKTLVCHLCVCEGVGKHPGHKIIALDAAWKQLRESVVHSKERLESMMTTLTEQNTRLDEVTDEVETLHKQARDKIEKQHQDITFALENQKQTVLSSISKQQSQASLQCQTQLDTNKTLVKTMEALAGAFKKLLDEEHTKELLQKAQDVSPIVSKVDQLAKSTESHESTFKNLISQNTAQQEIRQSVARYKALAFQSLRDFTGDDSE